MIVSACFGGRLDDSATQTTLIKLSHTLSLTDGYTRPSSPRKLSTVYVIIIVYRVHPVKSLMDKDKRNETQDIFLENKRYNFFVTITALPIFLKFDFWGAA